MEAVQRRGVRVTVVSTFQSSPPMVADELRRQADSFVELNDLASKISRSGNDIRLPDNILTRSNPAAEQPPLLDEGEIRESA